MVLLVKLGIAFKFPHMECCIQQCCCGYNGQTTPCAKCARGVILVLLHSRMAEFCLVHHATLVFAVSDLLI